jgi:inhibitor of KinA
MALRDKITRHPFPGLVETVPAYASLTVYYDPMRVHQDNQGMPAAEGVTRLLQHRLTQVHGQQETKEPVAEIPVCYDMGLGTDLAWVADYCRLSPEDVIRLHTAQTYRVYMIGFVPGFPYMGTVDPAIQVPRKQQPARLVPRGSVALAGQQTGIYPADIPGGWQVIGRTPWQMFNPDAEPCTTLRAGTTVRFSPISLSTYHQLIRHADTDY